MIILKVRLKLTYDRMYSDGSKMILEKCLVCSHHIHISSLGDK